MTRHSRVAAATLTAAALLSWSGRARAVDVSRGDTPVVLDVTDTTIVSQRFDARDLEYRQDTGWGAWINRLDADLRWGHWTAGMRLDSAVFWRRPIDNPNFGNFLPSEQSEIQQDSASRYQDSIYPAKLFATYSRPGIEVTAGDAYAQFGRGLTLSMRKVDELGIDTTIRGGKVVLDRGPFALTFVGGWANPSRVDEATGRELFVTHPVPVTSPGMMPTVEPRAPVFGSDRIVGADLQAGRGLPLILSTHVVGFSRCAPYPYDSTGALVTDFWQQPGAVTFGTCNASDWKSFSPLLNQVPRSLTDRDITMVGQSLEVPTLGGHGQLYLEAAAQHRTSDSLLEQAHPDGNALYGSFTYEAGISATTLEVKSNRNFYTVAASVTRAAPEFSIVAYSFLPPAESFNMLDAEGTGDFNACVEGGRLRQDINVSSDLLLWGQGIYAYSQSEQTDGHCDSMGHTISNVAAAKVQDSVWDGVGGVEWYFDEKRSHVFASSGIRDDTREDGELGYREQHAEYSIAMYIQGPWSAELQGRFRHRKEYGFNRDFTQTEQWWTEGENYLALRMAPKWVFTTGMEYTNLIGQPTTYFNGAVLYKFKSDSNVRVFVGQQRGAFRCASGLCRFFPAYEGARVELTLRF